VQKIVIVLRVLLGIVEMQLVDIVLRRRR